MKNKSVVALGAVIASTVILGAFANSNNVSTTLSKADFNKITSQGVDPNALKEALKAQQWAIKKGDVKNKRYLTIVNFKDPSTAKRMKVIDLKTKKVLFSELVSQGSGSGNPLVPTRFTDKNGSHSSVRGVLVTTNTYTGKHGESLRLQGLESFNKNAMRRDIVVHPAKYATEGFANAHGYLGRSWGCFAVDPSISKQIIQTIKGGTVIFAYAPQAGSSPNYA